MKNKDLKQCMGEIIAHIADNQHRMEEFEAVGLGMGATYTNHGLPIDMAMTRLRQLAPQLTDIDCAVILHFALGHLVDHKRASGATEKALDRQRKANNNAIVSFMNKGEAGLDV